GGKLLYRLESILFAYTEFLCRTVSSHRIRVYHSYDLKLIRMSLCVRCIDQTAVSGSDNNSGDWTCYCTRFLGCTRLCGNHDYPLLFFQPYYNRNQTAQTVSFK